VKRIRQHIRFRVNVLGLSVCEQLSDRHPVLSECAGLINAQHRGRAECFDGVAAAGENLLLRDAPGAQRQEDRQHYRELLREQGHGCCDSGENSVDPTAAGYAVDNDDYSAQREGQYSQNARQAIHFTLQPGSLWLD
jgi:hypothetical protein